MFGNMGDMMKQAQVMQDNIQKMQEEVVNITAEGHAGGGMVSVTLNGKGHMTALSFDDSLDIKDMDIIKDLIITAHQQAKDNIERKLEEKMQSLTGGLGLPKGMISL